MNMTVFLLFVVAVGALTSDGRVAGVYADAGACDQARSELTGEHGKFVGLGIVLPDNMEFRCARYQVLEKAPI